MIDVSLLKVLFDDDVMITKYLIVFREDVPQTLQGLRTSINNLDWENASITAHNLKSKLQYLKEEILSQLAYEIENICDQSDPSMSSELHSKLDKIDIDLKEVYNNIDTYLRHH